MSIIEVPGATVSGPIAYPVMIEVGCHPGLPSETIVGLPDTVVKESRSRIRSAIRHCKFQFPARAITINLAPAELKKEGPFFDLPIAVGILQATNQLPIIPNTLFVGELGLSGDVRPVRGIISMCNMASKQGYAQIVVPFDNASEATLIKGITVIPIKSIQDLVDIGENNWSPPHIQPIQIPTLTDALLIEDVRGQWFAKRALEISAAGSHNLLFVGSPGSGKTMLIRRLPSILPELTWDEAIDSLELHALIPGNHGAKLQISRPFRAPHHTVSYAGMVGGGTNPLPGEISLAHNGILFLDELPEYPRHILELLRQPLEDRQITISRAATSATYPANFTLMAAMNPCPCGYYGDPVRQCSCTPNQIEKYIKRISGPLLDRIDLIIEVPRPDANEWTREAPQRRDCTSEEIRKRVRCARDRQNARGHTNASLPPHQLQQLNITDGAQSLINGYLSRGMLTGRSHDKIIRVSQTIADLANNDQISETHVSEALQFRSPIGAPS